MACKLRPEYPGAIDHVLNRGDRRELIFMDDADPQRFVETLAEACARTRCKGAAKKVALAERLRVRVETTRTVRWIAQRLRMGTRGHLNPLLYRKRKRGGDWSLSRTDPFGAHRILALANL